MTEEVRTIVHFSEDISEATAPEPLPAGVYNATVSNAEIKTSSAKQTQYLSLTFRINPEDYPADYPIENAPDGVSVNYYGGSAEDDRQSRFRLKQLYQRLGLPLPGRSIDCNQFLHVSAQIQLKQEIYNDIPKNAVEKLIAREA
jgi:hypothetical protein